MASNPKTIEIREKTRSLQGKQILVSNNVKNRKTQARKLKTQNLANSLFDGVKLSPLPKNYGSKKIDLSQMMSSVAKVATLSYEGRLYL